MAQQSYLASFQTQGLQQKIKKKFSDISNETKDKLKDAVLQCFSLSSNREKFCDFAIVVGDTEFHCHRFVLSACSGFFEALLRSDMKERREMKANVHGISPEIFKLVLDAMYGSSEALAPDKMIDVWKAAHQLQMQSLISTCEEYYMQNIKAEQCYLIYTNAQLLHSPQVISSVINCMVRHFYAFVHSEDFVKLDYEGFLQILQNTNLQVCSDFKVEAILKWCESEKKKSKSLKPSHVFSRLPLLGSLIQSVNLAQITTKCLASLLTNQLIQENKKANAAVNSQAAKNLVNPTSNGNQSFFNAATHNIYFNPNLMGEKHVCQHCYES